MAEAYIVDAVRTAGGRRGGRLKDWHPAALAGKTLDGLVEKTGVDGGLIEDVVMGCVGQVGEQSNNIARNAVLSSKLPEHVPATSVDRQCGSSQQALHFAAQAVMSGCMDVVVACGVESMSRVPMGLSSQLPYKNGFGRPFGPAMEERYPGVKWSQFTGAEMIAKKYDFSRGDLDAFALTSHQKAKKATENGWFKDEIIPIEVELDDGTREMHLIDEGIRFDATIDSIGSVKLLDEENGRLTAATSSQICDGSSAALIVSEEALKQHNLTPLAKITHLTVTGGDPIIMLEEPLFGTEKALKKTGLKMDDIDLFEVNEAFASVPMAFLKHLDGDVDRLNVHGGAIALGHPLGASGTKLMSTLTHALKTHGKKRGLQTMCEGGGLTNVTIVELC